MRHLFRLINSKNRVFFNAIMPQLALVSPLSPSAPILHGCLVTLAAGLADTCSPILLIMICRANVSSCHRTVKFSGRFQLNCRIRDFLGSPLLLLCPTQRYAPFSILVISISPRRQHVKNLTFRPCRQSCLYSGKSGHCFELSEKNSPWVSQVSARLANEASTVLRSRQPI